MAGQTFLQAALVGGEVAPGYYGRVDLPRYLVSVKTLKNFYVQPAGGVKNRPGTRYIGAAKYADKAARLIPFVFSSLQTYVLEFGDYYMRVFTQGGQMVLQPSTIAGISAYSADTTYGLGALCSSGGIYYYSKVAGNIAHTPSSSPTYWLALTGTTVEIPTPWPASALPLLKFTQSADVMTFCHPDYPPYDVKRIATDQWTCTKTDIERGPFLDTNEDTRLTVFSTGLGGSVYICPSSAIFKATDVGRLFFIRQQNAGKSWVSNTAMTLNEIRRAVGNYYTALAAGTTGYDYPQNDSDQWNDGGVNWQFLHPGFGIVQITAYPVSVTETAYAAGTTYAKDAAVSYGGKAYVSLQASNTGHQPDTNPTWWVDVTNRARATVIMRVPDAQVGSGNTTYKWAFGAWTGVNGYPACTTYHQQRQVFAGTYAAPQTVWLSKTGDFSNFGVSAVSADDDALTYPLDGRMVSAIKHVMTMGAHLIVFNSDSEWSLSAPGDGALSPSDVNAKLQGFRGSSDLMPLMVGEMALYVQSKGQSVRDLGYDYYKNSFTGIDLTQYASHLVENHTIMDWTFQQNPASTVWCVRDDGVLLSLAYVKDQQVIGWGQHSTDGYFESVCCVSEGQEDAVYFIVRRVVNGSTVRYVERLANRLLSDDILDSCFLDAAVSYDGTNTTSTTVTVTPGETLYGVTENNEPFVPSGTSGQLYIGGAQVVDNASITSLYRTDWQGTVALSVSPRTNLLTYSQDFSQSAWPKSNASIGSSTTAPDGTNTALLLVEGTNNGGHLLNRSGVTPGTQQTLSIYAKASTRTQIAMQLGSVAAYFNLSTGVVISGSSASIVSIGNGWYRCSVTATPGSYNTLICLANNGSAGYQGDGVSGVYLWGAQLETGSLITPYIPTTTAPVTVTDYAYTSAGAVTLGEAASGTYTWSGSGDVPDSSCDGLLKLSASADMFNASTDVGDEIVLDADGGRYGIKLTQVSSTTLAYGIPHKLIDAAFQGVATTDWSWARTDLSGLGHLEGKTLGIYADGYVQSCPTVSGGAITLDTPATRVWAGLPYVSDLETLNLATNNGVPLQDKLKNIAQVVVQIEASRGLKAGPTFDKLTELKQGASYTAPPAATTGPVALHIDTLWSTGGHVCLRQDYPLPMSIQAIVPQVQFSQR